MLRSEAGVLHLPLITFQVSGGGPLFERGEAERKG